MPIPANHAVDFTNDVLKPEYIHVYPTYGRSHVLEGLSCWCHPERDKDEATVIIHHEDN